MRGFLTLACFAMIIVGSQAAYTVLNNRAPVKITLAKYQKEKPAAKWLQLTECELDLPGARYFNYIESDHAPEPLIPLISSGGASNQPIHALAAIRDEKLRRQIEALSLAETVFRPNAPVETNTVPLFVKRDVKGLVRFGWESATDNREELLALHPGLAEDFIIIDAGSKPSWPLALMLPAGLGLMIWLLVSSMRNFKKAAQGRPPQSAAPSPSPTAASTPDKSKGAPGDAPS